MRPIVVASRIRRLPTRVEVAAWLARPENQARLFIYAWYVALGMMVLGYVLMAYLLFFQ